jgi:hypothetical protein
MPNIKDQSTVEAIAREYCSNGRNKLEALKTIGYKESYYNTRGLGVVYGNVRVIEAIRAIDGAAAARSERTVKSVDAMYQDAYDLASTSNQPSAMVSAATGIARLYAMDKDSQANPDKPQDLTPEQHQQALDASNRQLDVKLSTGGA